MESVRTTETHIEIMHSVVLKLKQKHAQKALVLTLLGRASLPDNLREEHMSLEYRFALDTLSVRDSFCATDKTIYITIVVASISLQVFFIATQVVEAEKRKNQETKNLQHIDAVATDKTNANMSFLRMRVHS
jgi:hypothetical protein